MLVYKTVGIRVDASRWIPKRVSGVKRFLEVVRVSFLKWLYCCSVVLFWFTSQVATAQQDAVAQQDATAQQDAVAQQPSEASGAPESTPPNEAIIETPLQSPVAELAVDKLPSVDGFWIKVRFPLTEADNQSLRARIQEISDKSVGVKRPVVVVEFVRRDGVNSNDGEPNANLEPVGRGTEFERALAIARFLVGPVALRCRTIGYCSSDLEGHAVMVALACEEIVVASKASVGRIAIDESVIDRVVIDAYQAIAKRRENIPTDAVTSMIDATAGLFRVELIDGRIDFMSTASLQEKRKSGDVRTEDKVSIDGQLGNFTGQEMRKWLWIRQLVQSDVELKDSLGVDHWVIGGESLIVGPRKPGVVEIRGVVTETSVSRWMRAIDEVIAEREANLILLDIQTPGGDLTQSLRISQYIADLDESKVETIAWVNQEVLGDGVLIAMACDRMYLKPNSILGGPGEASIGSADVESFLENWNDLSKRVQRTPGEIYSLLSPSLVIHEFENEAGRKEVGAESIFFANNAHPTWKVGELLKVDKGMPAEEVVNRRWAKGLEISLDDLATTWGITDLPAPKRLSRIEQLIQRFASQEWLATMLLITSFSLITKEFAAPGMGIPGFLALVCFSLFVWMKVLGGTVEWLEIILIGAGLLCVAFEIFVLPGFGIFGFGGLIMMIAGIVLASQTYVVPTNDYQWRSTAWHTLQVAIACLSVFAMLYWMKDHLEQLPFFRWLKLEPPVAEAFTDTDPDPLAGMIGQFGVTTTICSPYGKAKIANGYFDVHSQDGLLGNETPVKVIGIFGKSMEVVRVDRT